MSVGEKSPCKLHHFVDAIDTGIHTPCLINEGLRQWSVAASHEGGEEVNGACLHAIHIAGGLSQEHRDYGHKRSLEQCGQCRSLRHLHEHLEHRHQDRRVCSGGGDDVSDPSKYHMKTALGKVDS